MWLRLGPVAVKLDDTARDLVSRELARLVVTSPEPARVVGTLVIERLADHRAHASARADAQERRDARVAEPLTFDADEYRGPGFTLRVERASDRWRARVASTDDVAGAIAALLIDVAQREPFLLFHAASFSWRGDAFLLLGASGFGKSTWVARHRARAIGSNAALVWRDAGVWRLEALPLTGRDDAAVRAGAYPVRGVFALGERRLGADGADGAAGADHRARRLAEVAEVAHVAHVTGAAWLARITASVATAKGISKSAIASKLALTAALSADLGSRKRLLRRVSDAREQISSSRGSLRSLAHKS